MTKKKITTKILGIIILLFLVLSCSTIDFIGTSETNIKNESTEISLVTYNIKAIYEKEEDQLDSLMNFINENKFDFVLFQELFNETSRDYIIEKSDTNFYKTFISRVDYNSFPEFIFQDAGLYMMGSYPRIDLSEIEFDGDIKNSNGVIHMILDKEMSKTNDFLANKSIVGGLFSINKSTQLFLFNTHVQAIGTREHKEYQFGQIKEFIENAITKVLENGVVKEPENLIVILAGDFNNNAYSYDRFSKMVNLLGNPRDLHKDHHGANEEYTFRFGSRSPSRRFDYILAYDMIGNVQLKNISVKSITIKDVRDIQDKSISDHSALRSELKIN